MAIWEEPQLLSGQSPQITGQTKPELGIYIIHQDHVTMEWALRFRQIELPPHIYVFNKNQPYDTAREMCVRTLIEKNVKYIFSLDSDVLIPLNTVASLIQLSEQFNLPVISGLYWAKKQEGKFPAAWLKIREIPEENRIEYGPLDIKPHIEKSSIVPVDVIGAGCLLVKAEVFKQLDEKNPDLPFFAWGLGRTKLQLPGGKPLPQVSEDFFFCLPPGHFINTHEGHKKIEEVKQGDKVVSHTGWNDKVKNIFCRPYKGEIIEIKPDYSLPIQVTSNHPILIRRWIFGGKNKVKTRDLNGQEIEVNLPYGRVKEMWVNASEIIPLKDKVFLPKPSFLNQTSIKYIYPRYISANGPKPHKLPKRIEVDKDLLWYLGLMIADGHCSRQPTIILNANEEKKAEKAEKILIKKFGVEPNWKYLNNALHLVSSHKELGSFLVNTIGKKSNSKHLPDFCRTLRENNLSSLLRGYFDGDGCVYPPSSNIISATTKSVYLAHGIHEALFSLNILNSMRKNNDCYTITIPTQMHNRFFSTLEINKKPIKPQKMNYWYKESNRAPDGRGNGGFWVQVRNKKTYDYDGIVYNLETEKYNTFTAHSIAVHNCKRVQDELGIRPHVATSVLCDHICLTVKKGKDGEFELTRM